MGGHCWQDQGSEDWINARYEYYATKRNHATLACIATPVTAGAEARSGCADSAPASTEGQAAPLTKRGRPRKGEIRDVRDTAPGKLEHQRGLSLA